MTAAYLFMLLIAQIVYVSCNKRLWCPPKTFLLDYNHTVSDYRTAVITESFGILSSNKTSLGPHLASFADGNLISRNIFNHVAVLGIDVVYLAVFYDIELFPKGPPTINDIYPSDKFCVMDWYQVGALNWRPIPYGGPKSTWLRNKHNEPTLDRDHYKTLRGFNVIYSEIMNFTDWIFVLDSDEYMVPVNFNVTSAPSDWCSSQNPSLITRILNQMLMIASHTKLDSYENMMKRETLDANTQCLYGYSYNFFKPYCKPVAAFSFPVNVWLQLPTTYTIPQVRSKFYSAYVVQLNEASIDGQIQTWKSAYQTKFNPPLGGRSLHHNPAGGHSILAPREFHGGLSLEVAHARVIKHAINNTHDSTLLIKDNTWVTLIEGYEKCANRRRKSQK